ncbi:hypothetical protein AVEN_223795-1 [Araneus ventricosus]|uniref:Uncharacterized protein n=1 Tax=Araneus ventricosus TaxID=182803 RepID=A0A4Y2DML7_ARAVE|nr:hypothetical protein AVEN_223795-1 [Araneus ventricosus]
MMSLISCVTLAQTFLDRLTWERDIENDRSHSKADCFLLFERYSVLCCIIPIGEQLEYEDEKWRVPWSARRNTCCGLLNGLTRIEKTNSICVVPT